MTTPKYHLIRVDDQDGVPVVTVLCSELRTDTLTGQLEQEIDDFITGSGAKRLVLDMTGVHFLASTGLRALIVLRNRLRERGGRFTMYGVHPYVEEVFQTTRVFSRPFDVLPDVETATAALKADAAPEKAP